MIDNLCTICARGGSKGVKNKNSQIIGGLPLIAHSIIQAQQSGIFSKIAVSSDSQEILNIAEEFGVDYCIKRPKALASDTAGKLPAIRHCVRSVIEMSEAGFSFAFDLDATSPLRSQKDIERAFEMIKKPEISNILSACASRRSPYFNMVKLDDEGIPSLVIDSGQSVLRRQDAPDCYDLNASIYAWKIDALLNEDLQLFNNGTRILLMPEERSLDIDTHLDFKLVEFVLANRGPEANRKDT